MRSGIKKILALFDSQPIQLLSNLFRRWFLRIRLLIYRTSRAARGNQPSNRRAAPSTMEMLEQRSLKLLLLGSSDTGKTTIVRQMQNIYPECSNIQSNQVDNVSCSETTMDAEQRAQFKPIVQQIVLESLRVLLANCLQAQDAQLLVAFECYQYANNPFARLEKNVIEHCTTSNASSDLSQFLLDQLQQIEAFWKSPKVQHCYAQLWNKSCDSINTWTPHFLASIKRIALPNYVPTVDDILRINQPTHGAADYSFRIHGSHVTVKDIGGQISERGKWLTYISQSVGWMQAGFPSRRLCLLYVASLADYDRAPEVTSSYASSEMSSVESTVKTKLVESMSVLQILINLKELQNVPVFVLLNKEDLFEEKFCRLKNFHLYFPDFSQHFYSTLRESVQLEKAKKLIAQRFSSAIAASIDGRTRQQCSVVIKFTSAVNAKRLEAMFNAICEDLLDIPSVNCVANPNFSSIASVKLARF